LQATDMIQHVGKIGKFSAQGLTFPVRIKNARYNYGHLDYLVTPVEGEGETWVLASRIFAISQSSSPVMA
jgi:hypothetical protein